jgi:uncharacterized protein YbbC (DUF1343 family)
MVGAPYIDDVRLADELNRAGLEGVRFVPLRFTPAASTFSEQMCGGVSLLLTDRDRLAPVDLGITLALTLQKLYPSEFALDKIRHLLRHDETLEAIRKGNSLQEIKALWALELNAFTERRASYLLYN